MQDKVPDLQRVQEKVKSRTKLNRFEFEQERIYLT